MLTLDNHLTGVTVDRPHPQSASPDLPLKGEHNASVAAYYSGYRTGHTEGRAEAKRDASAKERALTAENVALRKQLEAKRA